MTSIAGLHLAPLLVTPFVLSIFSQESCLASNYYGAYDSKISVFRPDENCLSSLTPDFLSSTSVVPVPPTHQLIWIGETAIEVTLKSSNETFSTELDTFLGRLSTIAAPFLENQEALVFPDYDTQVQLVYRTSNSAILSLAPDLVGIIDTFLPRFWRAISLPTSPVSFRPVPPSAVAPVKHVLSTLRFNPDVAAIVNNISIPQMRNDIRFLTGEDVKSGILSRHSFSQGSRTAAAWLKEHFEATGASCELRSFLVGFAPNVVW